MRAPRIAVPGALAVGFLALNVLGMLFNVFFLGLAVFHLAVGTMTLLPRRGRGLGGATLLLALTLGVLTSGPSNVLVALPARGLEGRSPDEAGSSLAAAGM